MPRALLEPSRKAKAKLEKPVNRLPTEAENTPLAKNLTWLAILMAVWFIVSFGGGVLLVDWLDQFNVPGSNMKLGFWIAQQGSIHAFILLIAVYPAVMNKLDRDLLANTGAADDPDS